MAQRPVILQSRFLRQLCPPQHRSRTFTTIPEPPQADRAWSDLPTSAPVTDEQINRLASKPLHPLILADLVRHGRPPLSTSALLASANFTLSLLPQRLAHRLRALRNLPFIVVSNPHIARIHGNYLHSLRTILPYHERSITTLEEEMQFTEVMADLVQTHANTIPFLARGFLECRRYINPEAITRFLDEHLRARIGTRLIAEQHIALHLSSQPRNPPSPPSPSSASFPTSTASLPDFSDSHIGIIDTLLRPAPLVTHCESCVSEICELKYGVRPRVVIKGNTAATLAHVPTHLEYIFTELLKNAFRATVESGHEREPVEVTIADSTCAGSLGGKTSLESALSDHQAKRTDGGLPAVGGEAPTVTIRIRDRGGGIDPQNLPHIWGYSFTTFGEEEMRERGGGDSGGRMGNNTMDALNTLSASGGESSSLAGLGYGLPLSRAYAEYLGGGIEVQSLFGWGTDVYLRLRGLGR